MLIFITPVPVLVESGQCAIIADCIGTEEAIPLPTLKIPFIAGDQSSPEASGREAIVQLELLLRCAVRTQAAVAPPPPEPQLQMTASRQQ